MSTRRPGRVGPRRAGQASWDGSGRPSGDLSSLSPPGQVADWRMTVLFVAVARTGVFAQLPGTADDLAASLGLDPNGLRVVLDALRAWGIVEQDRSGDGRYAMGPEAPGPEAAATIRQHARAIRRWGTSVDDRLRGVLDDSPAGIPEPEVYLDALAVTARETAPELVDLCLARFPQARSVVDLGGCHGEYSLEFARRGLKVTMQDMPTMIDIVQRRGQLASAGVELFAGSFFEEVPEGPFDLAFCAGITHTFDGDHNLALYGRLRPVVNGGGGIAVVTFLRGRQPLADVFAVQMLVNGNGGDTHAEAEYRAWLTAAGFRVDEAPVDIPDRAQSVLFAT